ncbi:D-aminoacyl-tRNA deacylase [Cerasicoccus arenae]|uniref:D-aminoacyl-tRNA deacylase n=1 Tax=Cerasicoccus arenae TaxID=424488 RepID=A0A8J3D9E2_9BACT|nr:D-aminoacyl-tRNA deacylase [Cerasicoccus arenae]MBK1857734.1 D-tyrosyl-tRNA(Tyr) deacylase [Cerasicoccus arenae]GHB91115.1 D-aminoacyl-tRNA deacylase [Cerasicoccus arenae]
MRAVVQRVTSAICRVDGEITGEIGAGMLVFLGVGQGDDADDAGWLVRKIAALRIFEDDEGRMNRSLVDSGGGVLVISQFTLYGNVKKGARPSFNRSAPPAEATALYEHFKQQLATLLGHAVPSGVFAADMQIEAHNDGPVTLVIDTRQRDL